MNRAFIFLATLVVLILFGGQSIAKNQKPSEDMILILNHHKSGPYGLSSKGLPEDKAKTEPSKTEMAEYEVYHVPHPQEMAHCVYLHIKSGRYWIYEIGGAAMSTLFFGPGLVKDLRK